MAQTVGPEAAAGDAVGLNLANDGANDDGRVYLDVLTNQPQHIQYEMWE